jgi:hypothetical protein
MRDFQAKMRANTLAVERGLSAAIVEEIDDVFRQLSIYCARWSGLKPRTNRQGAFNFALSIQGPALRQWVDWPQEADEDGTVYPAFQGFIPALDWKERIAMYTPTISVSVLGADVPFIRAKYQHATDAMRAYTLARNAARKGSSIAMINCELKSTAVYPDYRASVETYETGEVIARSETERKELDAAVKEVSRKADKVLASMDSTRTLPLETKMRDRFDSARALLTLVETAPADVPEGSAASMRTIVRTMRAIVHGSPSRFALIARVERMTGEQWADILLSLD